MAVPTLYVKSNTAAILAAMTSTMGIENAIGAEEDARRGSARRVVWVPQPNGRRYEAPTQQRADMKVCHTVNARFAVHLWGRDFFDAEELEEHLVRALFNRLSPNAYALGDGDPRGGDDPQSKGYEIVVPVTLLRIPLAAERHVSTTLERASVAGQVAHPIGSGTESAGAVEITF